MEPFNDSSDYEVRREQQYELLGTRNPRCEFCDETDPDALVGRYPDILCREHLLISEGKQPTEEHHPSGKHNDPGFTVTMLANDHAILTDRQKDWPVDTLRNPSGSILIKAAAAIRGFLDVLRLIIDRVVGWVPDFLESLDSKLTAQIGREWWKTLGYKGEIPC